MKKKLTNTKGFPLVMMIFAFLFSALAVVQEFGMLAVYKLVFGDGENTVNYVLLNSKGYLEVYSTALTMFAFTFLAMLVLFAGTGRRTTGSKEGVLLVIMGLTSAIIPTLDTIRYVLDGNLNNTNSDGELFRAVNQAVAYGLPAFISFLVILSGLGILIKVAASKTTVEVFKNAPKAVSGLAMPQEIPTPAQEIPQPVVEPVMEEAVVPAMATVEEVKEDIPQPVEVEPVIQEKAQENICKNCGVEYIKGAKFCKNCGAEL